MGLYDNTGARLTKSGFPKTSWTDPDPKFVVNGDIYRKEPFPGADDFQHVEGEKKTLAFKQGDIISQSQLDALYPPAVVDSLSPSTGLANGTVVTIKGKNLDGVTSVTFGGTAGTSLTYVDTETIKVTAPTKSTGAYNVVVVDDSGSVTKTNGATYA